MTLRILLVLLVLANVGYLLWSRVDAPARQAAEREPQRMTQQINPQWLDVVPIAPIAPGAPASDTPSPAGAGAR